MNQDDDRFEPLDADRESDQALANDFVGSTLFVGITQHDSEGSLLGKTQVFGTVESVGEGSGIIIIQTNGEPYVLAPVLDAIEVGEIDFYQLSEDHELVENPDYVMWVTATDPTMN
jgi:hypothetical protein